MQFSFCKISDKEIFFRIDYPEKYVSPDRNVFSDTYDCAHRNDSLEKSVFNQKNDPPKKRNFRGKYCPWMKYLLREKSLTWEKNSRRVSPLREMTVTFFKNYFLLQFFIWAIKYSAILLHAQIKVIRVREGTYSSDQA